MKSSRLLVCALFIFSLRVHAQLPGWEWARGSTTGTDGEGRALATDALGNVYNVGVSFYSTMTFGGITLTTTAGPKPFIVKYDGTGNVLWAKTAQCEGAYFNSVAVDSNGNVFVSGSFRGPSITLDTFTVTHSGAHDYILLIKFDSAGNIIWVQSPDGNTGDHSSDVVTDAAGNSYITGSMQSDSLTFGTTTLYNVNPGAPQYAADIFVAKYNSAGTMSWATSIGGVGSDAGSSIAADAAGNTFVTGIIGNNSSLQFGGTTLTGNVTNMQNIFTAKFDPSGNALWAKGAGPGDPMGIAIDGSGNSYVTGNFSIDSILFDAVHVMNVPSTYNGFLTKYDGSGNVQWAKAVISHPNGVFLKGIAVTSTGREYVTGIYGADSITFGNTLLTSSHSWEVFAAQYDSNGNALWAADGTGCCETYMQSNAVAVDASGNAFITGRYDSAYTVFGSDTATISYFIAKLSYTTGIGETKLASNDLSVSPNPFNASVVIHFPGSAHEEALLQVYNSLGERMKAEKIFQGQMMDFSEYPGGFYFLSIQTRSGFFTGKIVK